MSNSQASDSWSVLRVFNGLARVKLRHLDEYTACAQKLCDQLTEKLRPIEGLTAPHVPPDRTHSYYYFPVQVHPERLQLDIEPGKLRAAVMQALNAENVVVSGWQTSPIPAQFSFQKQNDSKTRSHPWNHHGREVIYDIDEYRHSWAILENSFIVWQLTQPSTLELVERYADAFEKVFANIERVVEIYESTNQYVPLAVRKDEYRVSTFV